MIKSSSTGQAVQALSSGEAEYVSCVKGASLGLGCASMSEDFGMPKPTIILESDSAAAKGICSRIGLGRIRHLSTTLLWLQGYIEKKLIEIRKVLGTENSADLGTKDVGEAIMRKMLGKCNYVERSGRHPLALRAADSMHPERDDHGDVETAPLPLGDMD